MHMHRTDKHVGKIAGLCGLSLEQVWVWVWVGCGLDLKKYMWVWVGCGFDFLLWVWVQVTIQLKVWVWVGYGLNMNICCGCGSGVGSAKQPAQTSDVLYQICCSKICSCISTRLLWTFYYSAAWHDAAMTLLWEGERNLLIK